VDRKKSPVFSSILSLIIPGLGQIYVGQSARGMAFLATIALASLLVYWRGNTPLYSGIAIAWLWNIWDAYHLARGRKLSPALPFFVIALVIYIIGWGVTEINLTRLITDVSDIKPLVSDLLRPAFLERDIETQVGEIIFEVPCSDNPPPKGTPLKDKPYLIILDKTCGEVGDTFTIEGGNFWPNSRGQIWWTNIAGEMQRRIRQEGKFLTFETDEQGRIPPLKIVVPQPFGEAAAVGKGPLRNRVQARLAREVGPLHPSHTFFVVAEKMLETIFLWPPPLPSSSPSR